MTLQNFENIDWTNWTPQERATLLFVRRDGQVLLIRKKRGLGAGKINGPGGRIYGEETPLQAAIREVEEELHVTPTNVEPRGELAFQFVDGYALFVYVFSANDCIGEPQETDEATPLWTPIEAVPFDQRWADDRIWFPHRLSDRSFCGRFLFDSDEMLGHKVVLIKQNEGTI